jgi:hypothetical protein
MTIDINCDLGEGSGGKNSDTDESLIYNFCQYCLRISCRRSSDNNENNSISY